MKIKEKRTVPLSIKIPKSLSEAIDKYIDDNHGISRSQAVIELVERGFRK